MNMPTKKASLDSQLKSLLIRPRGEFKRSSTFLHLKSSCFQMPLLPPAANSQSHCPVFGTSPANQILKDIQAGFWYLRTLKNLGLSICCFHLPLQCQELTRQLIPFSRRLKRSVSGVRRLLSKVKEQPVLFLLRTPQVLILPYHCYTSISCCPIVFKSQTDQDIKSYQSLSLIVHQELISVFPSWLLFSMNQKIRVWLKIH